MVTPPELAADIGFDREPAQTTRWLDTLWASGSEAVGDVLTDLERRDHFRFLVDHGGAPAVRDAGRRYLHFRTHILRYAYSEQQLIASQQDAVLAVAAALAVDGNRVSLAVDHLGADRLLLVEGSNLLIDPRQFPQGSKIVLDGAAGVIEIAGNALPTTFHENRIVVRGDGCPGARVLLDDGQFFHFFVESCGTAGREVDRRFAASQEAMENITPVLAEAARYLQDRWPGAWAHVRQHVLYLSWTSLSRMESSTDTRDPRGSVVINPRTDVILDNRERFAWLAQGLYHEAKHVQFFDTFRARVPPQARADDGKAISLSLSDMRVPCAWKGAPSDRSLADHLMSLHAFIPGTTITLAALEGHEVSGWVRQHIEMDMRAINGAVGCLILGQSYLTGVGQRLARVLRRDYVEKLLPAYERLRK